MRPFFVYAPVIMAALLFLAGCQNADKDYQVAINEHRKSVDTFMIKDAKSPFSNMREPYRGLRYFDIDPRLRFEATFSPLASHKTYLVGTSTGTDRVYYEYGLVSFTLEGKNHQLLVLQSWEEGQQDLFLAFADETNGIETYGGGRYLDVSTPNAKGQITLDFNLAYNPYCAYNHTYECPLPPAQNSLLIAIRAGEKVYP